MLAQDGTSFSAPVVTGAVARLIQSNPTISLDDITSSILCASTRGIVAGNNDSSTPNQLLYVPATGIPVVPSSATCADATCPSSCGAGRCVDGWCKCPCFTTGAQCQTAVPVSGRLSGTAGTVTGSNVGQPSNFGQASGDVFYSLLLPYNATTLTLSTCGPDTALPSVLWVLSSCPSQQLNNPDVVAVATVNASMPCTAITSPSGSAAVLTIAVTQTTYFVLVEGSGSSEGPFTLSWSVGTSSSVGNAGYPSSSPGPVPSGPPSVATRSATASPTHSRSSTLSSGADVGSGAGSGSSGGGSSATNSTAADTATTTPTLSAREVLVIAIASAGGVAVVIIGVAVAVVLRRDVRDKKAATAGAHLSSVGDPGRSVDGQDVEAALDAVDASASAADRAARGAQPSLTPSSPSARSTHLPEAAAVFPEAQSHVMAGECVRKERVLVDPMMPRVHLRHSSVRTMF